MGYCRAVHTTYYSSGHLLNDNQIIQIAIENEQIIITKDSDFLDNYLLNGSPPKVLLLEFGNIRNSVLKRLFEENLPTIIQLFEEGADL